MKIRNISLIAIAIVALISVPVGTVTARFDPSGTSWSVASFENGRVGDYHPAPWYFSVYPYKYVSASYYWYGTWKFVPDTTDRIRADIVLSPLEFENGGTDHFDVVFLSPNWFIALKNNNLYRIGRRI